VLADRASQNGDGEGFVSKVTAEGAAFYGFGLIRRDPLTFLGVTLLMAGVGLYVGLVFLPAYLEFWLSVPVFAGSRPEPAEFQQALGRLVGAISPIYLIGFLSGMIMLGALNRALVFGKSKGWVLGLQLGLDEVRVILVAIITRIVAIVPGCVLLVAGEIAVLIPVGIAAEAAKSGSGGVSGLGMLISVLLGLACFIGGLVLMIWMGIRLSLAVPATVGEKRFVIFESWQMTKGRFWTLFLGYLLLFVIVYIAELVIFGIVMIGMGGAFASLTASSTTGGPEAFRAWVESWRNISWSPTLIAVAAGWALLYGVVATFLYGAFNGVAARVYQDWKSQSTAPAAFE
jgi:hypothetical protein